MEGFLEKRSAWLQNWKVRYFRIKGRTLCYYESEKKVYSRGEIPLIGARVSSIPDSTGDNTAKSKTSDYIYPITIETSKNQKYFLNADTEEARFEWITAISDAINGVRTVKRAARIDNDESEPTDIEKDTGLEITAELGEHTNVVRRYYKTKSKEVVVDATPPPAPSNATDPLSYLLNLNNDTKDEDNTSSAQITEPVNMKKKDTTKASKVEKTVAASTVKSNEPCVNSANSPVTSEFTPFTSFSKSNDGMMIDLNGDSLRDAIKDNNISAVNKILSEKPELSKFEDNQKQSVLHVAAIFGRKEIVELLVRNGADVHHPNSRGETSLDLANPVLAKFMKSINRDSHADEISI